MFFELKNEDKITKRQTFNKEIRSIISDKPNLKLSNLIVLFRQIRMLKNKRQKVLEFYSQIENFFPYFISK
jgi:hypothetical protein